MTVCHKEWPLGVVGGGAGCVAGTCGRGVGRMSRWVLGGVAWDLWAVEWNGGVVVGCWRGSEGDRGYKELWVL